MSRPGPFKMMARNWKKSLFYSSVASTSLYFTYDYTITNGVMKNNCKKATAYGDERLKNPTGKVRHITVILNPVACNRKAKKLYTKWVEPLLHLAGIKVSLVETESPKQAYELMRIMSGCDGVAIVGGDGTVHEALNGLLSRPDRSKAVQSFPIAIIPAGQYNSIARYVHQNNMNYRNQKEFLIESTMRLVEQMTQKFDVIQIKPLPDGSEENKTLSDTRPIYALRDLRYGIYQDNFYKISGIKIYQTYVKPLWLRFRRMISSSTYPVPKVDAITYTKPCIGCSACYNKHVLQDEQVTTENSNTGGRWWNFMSPVKSKSSPTEEEKRQLELSQRDNPECQERFKILPLDDVTDIRACMMGAKKVRLSIGRQREYTPSDVTETQDIQLKLSPDIDNQGASHTNEAGDDSDAEDDKKSVHFLVDGQNTPAHSVEVTALENAVTVFTGPYKIFIPEKASSHFGYQK